MRAACADDAAEVQRVCALMSTFWAAHHAVQVVHDGVAHHVLGADEQVAPALVHLVRPHLHALGVTMPWSATHRAILQPMSWQANLGIQTDVQHICAHGACANKQLS